ncbi:unnamed protein product [Prorocentrum cordatum]|uniref:RNA-directed DNA polymerase n=1 Tax=Prorocentrum cordatum TaxID=2364126 RepID=A0ABN9SLT8_9DINO|nr:unnamed protein product [Polarella glacialis]
MWNEDLKGFFPSVPQERLLEDVELLLRLFLDSRPGLLPESAVFTAFPREPKRAVVCGKVREASGVHVPPRVIVPVLQHAAQASVFECAGAVVRQIRGAFIGSPLSPPWCTVSVMMRERSWMDSAAASIALAAWTWTGARYVDNRVVLGLQRKIGGATLVPSSLLDPGFYVDPVVLEPEPDNSFVGVKVLTDGLRVEAQYAVYGFPDIVVEAGSLRFPMHHKWRYRSGASGGSAAVKVAGLLGRMHQAIRLSYPIRRARRAVVQLAVVYLALGHDHKDLVGAMQTVGKRYPHVVGTLARELAAAAADSAALLRLEAKQ